jgi:hypothetical protein
MSAEMNDQGNPENDWQGAIRFGPLDLVLAEYAARVAKIDGIIVNCLDQLPSCPRLVASYTDRDYLDEPHLLCEQERLTSLLDSAVPIETETTKEGILESLGRIAPIVGTAQGPTFRDRFIQSVGSGFRSNELSFVTP